MTIAFHKIWGAKLLFQINLYFNGKKGALKLNKPKEKIGFDPKFSLASDFKKSTY